MSSYIYPLYIHCVQSHTHAQSNPINCVYVSICVCALLALHFFLMCYHLLYERVKNSLPFSVYLTEVHGSSQCRGNNIHKQFNEFIFDFFVFSFLCYLLPLLRSRLRSLFTYPPWTWLENNPCSLTTNIYIYIYYMYTSWAFKCEYELTNSFIMNTHTWMSCLMVKMLMVWCEFFHLTE